MLSSGLLLLGLLSAPAVTARVLSEALLGFSPRLRGGTW